VSIPRGISPPSRKLRSGSAPGRVPTQLSRHHLGLAFEGFSDYFRGCTVGNRSFGRGRYSLFLPFSWSGLSSVFWRDRRPFEFCSARRRTQTFLVLQSWPLRPFLLVYSLKGTLFKIVLIMTRSGFSHQREPCWPIIGLVFISCCPFLPFRDEQVLSVKSRRALPVG